MIGTQRCTQCRLPIKWWQRTWLGQAHWSCVKDFVRASQPRRVASWLNW